MAPEIEQALVEIQRRWAEIEAQKIRQQHDFLVRVRRMTTDGRFTVEYRVAGD